MLDTMVIDVNADKVVTAMNKSEGIFEIQAKAIILAMGCRVGLFLFNFFKKN